MIVYYVFTSKNKQRNLDNSGRFQASKRKCIVLLNNIQSTIIYLRTVVNIPRIIWINLFKQKLYVHIKLGININMFANFSTCNQLYKISYIFYITNGGHHANGWFDSSCDVYFTTNSITLINAHYAYDVYIYLCSTHGWWVGHGDPDGDGQFEWSTVEPLDVSHYDTEWEPCTWSEWRLGEPNNDGTAFVIVEEYFRMTDRAADSLHDFICEALSEGRSTKAYK